MHLLLTNPHLNDLDDFHKMNQDPLLQKEFISFKNINLSQSHHLLVDNIRKSKTGSPEDFCFIKVAKQTNPENYYDQTNSLLLGFISVNESSTVEFDISGFKMLLTFGIMEKYRNKGLMTESLNFRIERFEELGYNILPAYVKSDNPASEKVLKKCGFIRIEKNEIGSTYVKRITLNQNQFQSSFSEI